MTNIITADYNGTQVFFQDDAFLNATAIAKHFNKLPNEWLRLDSTQEYIEKLCENLNAGKSRISENINTRKSGNLNSVQEVGKSHFIKTTRGVNGGTWLHRRLAVPFARWLNVEFAIWCDEQIEKILINKNQPKQLALPETITPEEQRQIQNAVKATHERTGLSYGEIWARAKNKFNVAKYEQIPRSQLRDVLIYIASMSAIAVKKPTLSYSLLYPLALLYYYSAEFHDAMVKQKAEEPKMWGLLNRQCRTMDRVRLAISILADELPDPEHKADILAFLES